MYVCMSMYSIPTLNSPYTQNENKQKLNVYLNRIINKILQD